MPRDEIKLGIAVSLSGRYAALGRQVLAGLECYVRDVNAAGGIRVGASERARPLALIAEDDQSRVSRVKSLVEHLIQDARVDLLMGPYGSGLTLAAAETANAAQVVLWNHSGSADQIFASGFEWVVGIISPASHYLCGVLELLRSLDTGARRVALFSADTGFAADMAGGVLQWLEQEHFELTTHRQYASGGADFGALLEVMASDPPDWLLGVGRVEDDLALAHQLCESRPPLKAVGLVVAAIAQFSDALGPRTNRFMAPSQWEPQVRHAVDCGPPTDAFVSTYRRHSSEPLDYPAAQGYAGGVIAQRCVELAGTLDQKALRAAANRLRCTTFYGAFEIDAVTGRQTAHRMLVTQWQHGEKKCVWPPPVAAATPIYQSSFWE